MHNQILETYSDAWNRHDIDTIMALMTEDCIFEPGGGPERYGTRYEGQEAVRERFIEVFTEIPDVRFENAIHFSDEHYGCSEWTIVGTRTDGTPMELDGCDLFTFKDGKNHSKRSYLKNRRLAH